MAPEKRKAAASEEDAATFQAESTKKVKVSLSAPNSEATEQPSPPEIPRNKTLPNKLEFEEPAEGVIRISSWNINSLYASKKKGSFRYIEAEDADVLVLTETRLKRREKFEKDLSKEPPVETDREMKDLRDIYPYRYWGFSETLGSSGVGILSKSEPLSVQIGLPKLKDYDSEGRIITIEFDHTYVIGAYVQNAGQKLKAMPEKEKWNAAFAAHLAECDSKKPTIWCGDQNVILDQRDISGAATKWNRRPGYTEIECEAHRDILDGKHRFAEEGIKVNKFKDIWRELHPDAVGHYTYYANGDSRPEGLGWRLDTFIVSKRFASRVKQCEIRHKVYGASDHVPVICDIKGPL